MSVTLRGQTYYRTTEVCKMVGTSRSTLLRRLRDGILKDECCRDRRGWRLFIQADTKRIKDEAYKINLINENKLARFT